MSDWLKNLKAGDAVVRESATFHSEDFSRRPTTADRVTAKLVMVGKEKFSRETGNIRPKPRNGFCRLIDPLEIERDRLLKVISNTSYRQYGVGNSQWDLMPLDKLRRIVDILEDREWVNGVPKREGLYWLWWPGMGDRPHQMAVVRAGYREQAIKLRLAPGDMIWGEYCSGEVRDWGVVSDIEPEKYWYCPMVAPSPPKIEPTPTE